MMKEMPTRGRPRQFNGDTVLAAALEVFRSRGYSGASIDDLTAATGLSRPSLYGAFGNKRKLFGQCIDFYWATAGRSYLVALFKTGNLETDLKLFFDAFATVACGQALGGCVVACAMPADAGSDTHFQEKLSELIKWSDHAVAARFQKAIDDNALQASTDINLLSQIAIGVMHSMSLRARAGASRQQLSALGKFATAMIISTYGI